MGMILPEGWQMLYKKYKLKYGIAFNPADVTEILNTLDLMKEMAEALEKQNMAGKELNECYSAHEEIKSALEKFKGWK